MNDFHLFDMLPIWAIALFILTLILLSALSGVKFVQWRGNRVKEDDGPLNTIVGANLALLAFILAFTFGLSTTRFDARKLFLLEEVNAIETAWLRAALVGEPYTSSVRDLLKEYVGLRIVIAENPDKVMEAIKRSNNIHKEIWKNVTSLIDQNPTPNPIHSLFVSSINEVFDSQTKRITVTLTYRIPAMIWVALFMLTIFSMFTVGYLFGRMKHINWYMILALSLAFTAVILVIIDLDSSYGTININHQPMYNLYQRISVK